MSAPELRCDRCSSLVARDDLRCPICNLALARVTGVDRAAAEIEILRCTGCGAAMTYDISELAAACAFCGSVLEVERPADPVEEAAQALPFTVDREQAEAALTTWLGGLGWFRPADLKTSARLETIRPLRWVAWIFDARADVSWTADTDHDTGRADWAPHAGAAVLDYDDVVVPATRGLTPAEVSVLVPSYDLASAEEIGDELDATTIERFDIPRSSARTRLVAAVEALAHRRLKRRHIPGRRVRNLHTATVLEGLAARRVAFPAWVLAYRYRDRLYRTVLSGQDSDCLKGEAPYSVARIAMVIAAVAAAGVAGLLALTLL